MLVPPMGAPVAALHAAIDDVRAVALAGVCDFGLVGSVEEIYRAENRLRAAQVQLLREAHERDTFANETGRGPKAFLVETLGMTPGLAGTLIRLSHSLHTAPRLAEAFDAGEVSVDHAVVVIRALAHVPDHLLEVVEVELVKLAREFPPAVVAQALDGILSMLGEDGAAQRAHERRFAERGVGVDTTLGGFASLNGTLSPEVAESLRTALASASQPCGPEDDRTQRQREHDALGEIANFYNAHQDLPAECGERPRVTITIPLSTLIDSLPRVAALGLFDSGSPVTAEAARRLACDAEIIPAVLGARGEVLDLGRASRTFSTAIKRAAKIRDGGRCAFPRCRRRIAECHHIVHWASGGASSLDNAAWLCTFHHWLAHEGGWTFWREAAGSYTWRSRGGLELTGDPPPHSQAA